MATLLKRIMVNCNNRGILLFFLVVLAILAYSFIRIYNTKPETGRRLNASNYRTSHHEPALQSVQQQAQQQQQQQQQQQKQSREKSNKPSELKVTLSENEAEKSEQQKEGRQQSEKSTDRERKNKEQSGDAQRLDEEKSKEKTDQNPSDDQKLIKSTREEKAKKEEPAEKMSEENKETVDKEKQKASDEVKPSVEGDQSQKTSVRQQKEKKVKIEDRQVVDAPQEAGKEAQSITTGRREEKFNKKQRKDDETVVKERSDELELDEYEENVPLDPKEAHEVVSQMQKTGNLLLDEFLSPQQTPPQTDFERLVHLDLKGAAPALDYLSQLLPLLKQAGATGLLIEYEDMFPYSGDLEVIKSRRAYDIGALRNFLQAAKTTGLQTVPLVQTFGHMEFVLKHNAFQHLREDPRYPAFLNPVKSEAVALVQKLVAQVMALHADSKYIHIGCDEVLVIGVSRESMTKMSQANYDKAELYLDYVRSMAKFINVTYPGVQTLIWDDILRQIPAQTLKNYAIGSYVEPVIWNYAKNVETEITTEVWQSYSKVFSNVWVASAFKGASGSVQHLPELSRHLQNHASWLKSIREMRQSYPALHLKGFILTGWSRYDHFSALCELLPASLPSLVACLQIITSGTWNAAVIGKVSELLHCSGPIFALNPETLRFEYSTKVPSIDELLSDRSKRQCQFPGDRIFYVILFYHQALESFDKYFDPITGKTRGQCNRFSLGHNFANPFAVEKVCLHAAEKVSQAFRVVERKIPLVLREIYSDGVSREWLDEHVISFETWLEQYYNNLKTITSKQLVWGERPENPVDGALIDKGQHQPN